MVPIKQQLKHDPEFFIEAVIANNPAGVADRLQSVFGIYTNGTPEGILYEVQKYAKDNPEGAFHFLETVINVPINWDNMNEEFANATAELAQEINEKMYPKNDQVFLKIDTGADPATPPTIPGGSGTASSSGSGMDWGTFLGGIATSIPAILQIFGVTIPNGQAGNQLTPEQIAQLEAQRKAEQTRKIIIWIVLIVVAILAGVVVFKAIKKK